MLIYFSQELFSKFGGFIDSWFGIGLNLFIEFGLGGIFSRFGVGQGSAFEHSASIRYTVQRSFSQIVKSLRK